jgi:Zn-dependent peptidase ImmA (M78 family)/transcriptional regulator with XRE-family HTH domain
MNYFPERLKNARKMRGFSLQELSDSLQQSISKQDLNRLETGQKQPDSEILSKLCSTLNVTLDYFFRKKTVSLEHVEFRKLKKLTVKEKEKVKGQTIEYLERYLELENLLGIKHNLPFHPHEYKIRDEQDVVKAARKMREDVFQIGNDPIYNIYELLEEKNIKVMSTDVDKAFSGMSTIIDNEIGVIVFNSNKEVPKVRKRFTLLHELGHLYMNLSDFDEKTTERYCDAFAGAMLLPEEKLMEYFGGKRDVVYVKELKLIKMYFGISLVAIMHRAKSLNLISDHYLKYFYIKYNKFYKKDESEGYDGVEESNRFIQLLIRAVAQEIISTTKAAALNNQILGDFREQFLDADSK